MITDSNIHVNFITVKTGSNPTFCKKVALLQGYRWDGPLKCSDSHSSGNPQNSIWIGWQLQEIKEQTMHLLKPFTLSLNHKC